MRSLKIAAIAAAVAAPAFALKYAAPEHHLEADPSIASWKPGPVEIAPEEELNLVGADSGAKASPEFKVLDPKPWLELTSWSGAPGAPVGFGGGGWIVHDEPRILPSAVSLATMSGPCRARRLSYSRTRVRQLDDEKNRSRIKYLIVVDDSVKTSAPRISRRIGCRGTTHYSCCSTGDILTSTQAPSMQDLE